MAKGNRTVYFDREKNNFVGLTHAMIKTLRETYKDIDVDQELNKMKIWLQAPKGKRRQGNLGFIVNWLNKSTPIARPIEFHETDVQPLGPVLDDYLRDLWKNREHILEFNTIRR